MFDPTSPLHRRELLAYSAAAALLAGSSATGADPKPAARKRYAMKKSINLWAFPYPEKMTLEQCLQLAKDAGFDGIELNYDLESDLSPKAGPKEFAAIRKTAERDRHRHQRAVLVPVLAVPAVEQRPGQARPRAWSWPARWSRRPTTWAPRTCSSCPGPSTSRGGPTTSRCRTTSATSGPARPSARCSRWPRSSRCHLNIENIFFNGYLMTPMEMNAFVDSFKSERVQGPLRHRQHHGVPVPRALDRPARQADQERPPEGVHQEGDRPLAGGVPPAARRHDQLAGGAGGVRQDRLHGLPDVRVLPPVPALSRGADLPDDRFARPDAGDQVTLGFCGAFGGATALKSDSAYGRLRFGRRGSYSTVTSEPW